MYVYVIMPIVIAIIGKLESLQYKQYIKSQNSTGQLYQKRKNIFYIFLILIFLVVGGFRYRVGTDFMAYYTSYQTDLNDIIFKLITLDEPGIYAITFFCRRIWNEGIFVIFVENCIISLLIFRGIKTYGFENITVPLLMYMFYCGWAFSFNGIRQALAIAIIFAFSKQEKKTWLIKYIIVIFIAFLFHKSAIFMLPILVIAHRKIDFMQLILTCLAAILIPYFGEIGLQYMGLTMGSSDIYFTNDINPIRIVVAIVPLVLIVILYLEKQEKFFDRNYFITNMIIINAILTVTTSGSAYMNRFARFTSIYTMIFIPKFADRLTSKSKQIFLFVALGLYFIMFLVEIRSTGSLIPFQWSFSHFGEY